MDPNYEPPAVLRFGRFTLLRHRRELFDSGRPIRLGSRAFDLLVLLVAARGNLVTMDEIVRRVWPGQVVEQPNVHVQIAALRKALGKDRGFIRSESGRGYRFVSDIAEVGRAPTQDDTIPNPAMPTNLPAPLSKLLGRRGELAELTASIAAHRLVTLTGPGASARPTWPSRPRASYARSFPTGSGSPSSRPCPTPIWS